MPQCWWCTMHSTSLHTSVSHSNANGSGFFIFVLILIWIFPSVGMLIIFMILEMKVMKKDITYGKWSLSSDLQTKMLPRNAGRKEKTEQSNREKLKQLCACVNVMEIRRLLFYLAIFCGGSAVNCGYFMLKNLPNWNNKTKRTVVSQSMLLLLFFFCHFQFT